MLGHLANIGYAKAGTESIYNIQMMEERHPVIGVGPSSSTKLPLADGHHLRRMNMPKNVAVYGNGLGEFCRKREEIFIWNSSVRNLLSQIDSRQPPQGAFSCPWRGNSPCPF